MEVELEINITPTNLPPITKDPVFLSTEADTLFILIANLKGVILSLSLILSIYVLLCNVFDIWCVFMNKCRISEGETQDR